MASSSVAEIKKAKKAAESKRQSVALRASERTREVARMDMPIGLMQLFAARRIAPNKRLYKELPPQSWNGGTIQINGPELDFFDQDVLFAILGIAMQQIDVDQTAAEAGGLFPALKTGGNAETAGTVVIKTSMAEIARVVGVVDGGRQEGEIRASIKRLSSIVVEAKADNGGAWATSHLIDGAAGYGRESVSVRLSWRLTRALLASGTKGGGSYVAVSLLERRQLKPGVPRLVHALLCNLRWGGGKTDKLDPETIRHKIYGTQKGNTRMQLSRQRQAVRGAITQIKVLPGWQ